jgi:metallophosphoesterase superfamily enzyme
MIIHQHKAVKLDLVRLIAAHDLQRSRLEFLRVHQPKHRNPLLIIPASDIFSKGTAVIHTTKSPSSQTTSRGTNIFFDITSSDQMIKSTQ